MGKCGFACAVGSCNDDDFFQMSLCFRHFMLCSTSSQPEDMGFIFSMFEAS